MVDIQKVNINYGGVGLKNKSDELALASRQTND